MDDGPPMRRVLYCQGYPTRDMENSSRPNWGISYDFKHPFASNSDKVFYHMKYQIEKDYQKNEIFYSTFKIITLFNDKEFFYESGTEVEFNKSIIEKAIAPRLREIL